jgi:hypothetical protein
MHAISIEFQPTMKVNIYNQCSDFKLTKGEYSSSGTNWNEDPDAEVDAGSMISVEFKPLLTAFGGVLTYQLQREDVNPGNRRDSTHIRLFVVWKSEDYKKFRVFVQLIECSKTLCWDEIKLEEYYQRYANQLCAYTDPIKDKWLIYDDTVLITGLELDFTQRDGVLNITISEGSRDVDAKRPEWISPER